MNASKKLYPWAVVAMLWCICFLNFADRQVIYSIFPLLEKEFHFSKFQLGLIGSAFIWVYAAFALVAGFAADRWARKILVIGGCIFWSVMTWGTAWCSQFWQFIIVRASDGLGEAFYLPPAMSLLADYHGSKTRSTAFSFHFSGTYLGILAGGSLGALLAQHFGWRFPFYFFGGLGITLSLIFLKFLKEPLRGAAEEKLDNPLTIKRESSDTLLENLLYLWKHPEALLLMVGFGSACIVSYSFFTWTPTFFYEKFHLSLTAAGFSAVLYLQLSSIAGALIFGKISDFLSSRVVGIRVMLQTIGLLLGIFFIIMIGKANTWNQVIIAFLGFGFAKGGYEGGLFPALYETILVNKRGVISGMNSLIGAVLGGVGPTIMGAIMSFGKTGSSISRMSSAFSWSAIFYGIAALCLIESFMLSRKK